MNSIALKPHMSEKAFALSNDRGTYVFVVPSTANKHTIAQAVSAQFNVTVQNVRVTNIKGKTKRTYRKHSRLVTGKRSDIKKAYVLLKSGDSIPVFAAVEEAEAKENAVQEKVNKAAEKQAKKETKSRRGLRRGKKEDA